MCCVLARSDVPSNSRTSLMGGRTRTLHTPHYLPSLWCYSLPYRWLLPSPHNESLSVLHVSNGDGLCVLACLRAYVCTSAYISAHESTGLHLHADTWIYTCRYYPVHVCASRCRHRVINMGLQIPTYVHGHSCLCMSVRTFTYSCTGIFVCMSADADARMGRRMYKCIYRDTDAGRYTHTPNPPFGLVIKSYVYEE